ncbi:helix-turn-helix domain-containing protein, partial [Streptomyces mirabilis]
MTTTLGSIELPDWGWERAEVRQALRARNVGALFRYAQQYTGVSQARIAAAVGMAQGCVNEIINGRREVSRLDVYERIADGLLMPDDARHLLGLAASREKRSGGAAFDLAAFPEVVRVYAAQNSAADVPRLRLVPDEEARREHGQFGPHGANRGHLHHTA